MESGDLEEPLSQGSVRGLWMEWAQGEGSEENGGTEDVSKTPPWVASDAIYLDKLMCFCIFGGGGRVIICF